MRGRRIGGVADYGLLVTALLGLSATTARVSAQPESQRSVLEEVVVTATRLGTNLQETPLSVYAFSGAGLELAGIDEGRDLGIMVPNVVINAGTFGEIFPTTRIRGFPGVAVYVDGFAVGDAGFLQRSFVDLERVEVLRGPQGTLFGRNTNGGAIQMVTRRPAEQFGGRLDLERSEFDRRTATITVDAPLTKNLRTKWVASADQSDGFMRSLAEPLMLGGRDNRVIRGDLLWVPSEQLSLRFNMIGEDRRGAPARVMRVSNPGNPAYIAYNVLSGNTDYLQRARLVDPGFPDPPIDIGPEGYTAESHQQGFPGGLVGRWQTREDSSGETSVDQRYALTTVEWRVGDRLTLRSLTAAVEADSGQVAAYDGSEFDFQTDLARFGSRQVTEELHLLGRHFNGRLETLLGVYYQDFEQWNRYAGWFFWEFAVPNTGPNLGLPGPAGTGGRPFIDQTALQYVNRWGATVGNTAVANYTPLTSATADRLGYTTETDRAFFGQLQLALNRQFSLLLGFRYSADDRANALYVPAEAFRSTEIGVMAAGDVYAPGAVVTETHRPDFGTTSAPKLALTYRPTDAMYLYASYAEGFTASTVVSSQFVANPIVLEPEVVATRELGFRWDWPDHRLRINATYFSSRWGAFRVPKRLDDPNSPGGLTPFTVPSSDGVARAEGLELELQLLPGSRWQLDLGLGLLDSEYVDVGDAPASGSGLQRGIRLAYAPERSYSLGARYRWPLASGATLLFAGTYGWMDEYQRASASELQTKNADGSENPEPPYGILNARTVYEPAGRSWQISLFGTNLTDEWYINGGNDAAISTGYDFGTIGPPREIGIGFQWTFN